MLNTVPSLSNDLSQEEVEFLKSFSKACRHSIIAMTTNAQSGHPGGALSCVDYLSLLYSFIISQTGEPVIISNGHISPAVYGVLAEVGYIDKKEAVEGFRKVGKIYEGHVTRHVPGVWYGTGPLGCGVSAASGFALAQKLRSDNKKVFALVGDGESEEGQVYEMANFSKKYKLDNLIVFMDYNEVQLTASLEEVMPYNPKAWFEAAGWEVIEVEGHIYNDMWRGLREAYEIKGKPVLLLGHTIMGKGVSLMESEGQEHKATWHGKTLKPEQGQQALQELKLTFEEESLLQNFRETLIKWQPEKPNFPELGIKMENIHPGTPKVYEPGENVACRNAYGNALLDLAKENKNIIALTADLGGSDKTAVMGSEFPERYFDVGIAEQQMVSCSGGLSLSGLIPFCSTFGAFMTSRAKDQARVNDINQANVKMVSTHCGLSVGEDGPTHQAIDDMGSFLGFFNTMQLEPADANHCDRLIRFAATHFGNFYVRMGRHKMPILTKEDGSVFFDENYEYYYGRCDVLRSGNDVTIIASGSVVSEAFAALENLKNQNISAELVIVSSIKKFDDTLFDSVRKTKKVIAVEDHNVLSGLSSQVSLHLEKQGIAVDQFVGMGVEKYQLSGTWKELYGEAGIDAGAIERKVVEVVK